MPTINVRAVNYNCNRCKQQPDFECQPCGHKICYDHYLGKNWSLEEREECCVHCGQVCLHSLICTCTFPTL